MLGEEFARNDSWLILRPFFATFCETIRRQTIGNLRKVDYCIALRLFLALFRAAFSGLDVCCSGLFSGRSAHPGCSSLLFRAVIARNLAIEQNLLSINTGLRGIDSAERSAPIASLLRSQERISQVLICPVPPSIVSG